MLDSVVEYEDRIELIARAQVELSRCLHLLVLYFPDSEFTKTPPKLMVVDGHVPVEEVHSGGEAHKIVLYTNGHLNRPIDQILTILLHQLVHTANGFR